MITTIFQYHIRTILKSMSESGTFIFDYTVEKSHDDLYYVLVGKTKINGITFGSSIPLTISTVNRTSESLTGTIEVTV